MPHLHRFLVPADTPRGGEVFLPEDEAHHAARVLRLRTGEAVELFDGAGGVWRGHIAAAGKRAVSVAIDAFEESPAPHPGIVLLQAQLQRPAAMEHVIVQGTVLGVTRFVFFRAAHSEKGAKAGEKWTRWAVEACKQCGRYWLPEFATADALEAALGESGLPQTRLIATAERVPVPMREALDRAADVAVIIGPEGDFNEAELALACARGAQPITLGPYTLRAEAAATLAVSLVGAALGRFG